MLEYEVVFLGRQGSGDDSGWRYLGLAFNFGISLALAMAIGYFGGRWLDGRLGTEPWFALVGLVLGVVAGFRILFREVLKAEKPPTRDDSGPDGPAGGRPGRP